MVRRLNSFGRHSSFLQSEVSRFGKRDSIDITEAHALRIEIAEIAFDHFVVGSDKMHCPERADRYAGAASDTFVIIYFYAGCFFIPRYGLGRARGGAGSILALLAGHGNINTFRLPFDDPNPAAGGIGHVIVLDRTDKLAQSASRTLFIIYFQNFVVLLHGKSPRGSRLPANSMLLVGPVTTSIYRGGETLL
jgi:hypothetical protein